MAIVQAKPGRKYVVLDANDIVTEVFTITTRAEWDDTLLKVMELGFRIPKVGWWWNGSKFVDPQTLPPPVDYSNADNLPKWARALGILIGQYANKTPAQVKQDYLTIYKNLP
jgi:hypothetical protein